MDGRGQVGTYHFSHDDWGQPGAGHRGQLPPATPLAPPMCVINSFVYFNCRSLSLVHKRCVYNLVRAKVGR